MPKWSSIITMIFFGFIFIVGLLNAIYPKMMWKTFESWKAKQEPTNVFFMSRRIAGIITMIIVLIMFLLPYFISKQ